MQPATRTLSQEHDQFRASLREFVAREISPHVNDWDEAGTFPRDLYRRAAELGATGLGFPEEYGGSPGDVFLKLILAEEYARCGAGGLQASLNSHVIALPPIVAVGSEYLKQLVLPAVLKGEKIAALAVTEPSGGSDVAAIKTRAVREGDHYVVNGEKTFITSGMRADFLTTAVRTDPSRKGADGISILLIDGNTPGLSRTELKKTGWWCSDTAHLRFDNCRVPVDRLIGAENKGFRPLMANFNGERLFMATVAYGFASVCHEEALDWARQRVTFGEPLVQRQVIRHKLVDMAMRIEASRSLVFDLADRLHRDSHDPEIVAGIAMAKIFATQTLRFCADEAIQILGGMGYMRGTRSERIYREVKVMMIGGGSEEILKDLAARQLGY